MRRTLALGGVALTVLGSWAAPARAVTPNVGQLLDSGTAVGADCTLDDGRVDGRSTSWEISNVIPAFKHGGKKGGVTLAPPAEQLPRIGKQPNSSVFGPDWVMTPRALATPVPGQGCMLNNIDIPPVVTTAPFGIVNVTLDVAGPHLMTRYESTVHFVVVSGGGEDPTPQPCAGNDPDFTQSADIAPPPDPGGDGHWAVDRFCNITINTGFNVKAASSCPASGDMSQWPGAPYINQYDAGARFVLPIGQGKAGGNACGPSSLLMAMLKSAAGPGPVELPTLQEAFDNTMRLPSTLVRPNGENVFVGNPKGVAFAKSMGWRQARTRDLGSNVELMEERILTSLAKGPIVISTAFGGATWGKTGGGHMIAIVGADAKGNFIVEDPAGNFFSTPKAGYSDQTGGHYGPRSCGHLALYPHYWLLAYTTGRWLLELGPRSAPSTSAPRRSAARVAAASGLGSAFAISDANPGGADAPASFWVQDKSGRRAGWIDGQVVEEIPDASVGQDVAGWTNPAIGDETGSPDPGDPPASPRAVVVSQPAAGLTIHTSAGGSFALKADAWEDGRLVGSETLRGSGTLTSAVLAEMLARPRLTAGKARVRGRVVSVQLRCTATAKSTCGFSLVVTAKQGKRSVTIAKAARSLASGKRATVRLRPTAAGRRLMAKKRRIAATLVVAQVRKGGTPVVVRTQKLRI